MPAPINPQLKAALDAFAAEPGVTPEQVTQLKSTIQATPALLRAFNEDAANGHLQGFVLAPAGPESIGRYDLASNKIAIPAAVLSGAAPVDPDLRAVLKLQDMSLRFARMPGVSADMHQNLERTINDSPVLVDRFKDAVRDEGSRHLTSFQFNSAPGAGGSYDPVKRSMNLTADSLASATYSQYNMTFVLGHELEHGFNRLDLDRSRQTYIAALRTVAGDANPVNDYTPAAAARMQAHRRDEAESHIAGWNAMLSYEKQRSGKAEVSLQDMWDKAERWRVADFVELDASGKAVAKAGLTFNADNSLTATTGPKGNVEAMGKHYFDQPPVGTPGVAAIDSMDLGLYRHSDYKNHYGASVVGLAIWAEREIAVPRHGNASQMRLNMQSLGFNEALLEENGISIAAGSTASQSYRDTSTSPATVGRFDHTYDGPNKNKHVPTGTASPAPPAPGAPAPAGTAAPPGTSTPAGTPAPPGTATPPGAASAPTASPAQQARGAQEPTLPQSGHPGHAMYRQALDAFDRSPNIPAAAFTPEQKQALAAAVVAQALGQKDAFPQAKIDHVVFNNDRSMVIGVLGGMSGPVNHLAAVDVQRGLATPLEQSSQASQAALESAQRRQAQAPAHAAAQQTETTAAPRPGL